MTGTHNPGWQVALLAVVPLVAGMFTAADVRADQLSVGVAPSDSHGHELAGPGYFVLQTKASKTLHLHVVITNHGRKPATLAIVPVDAKRNKVGNILYDPSSKRPHRLGSWIRLSRKRVVLAAERSTVVAFSVHIPKSTRPGLYIGALTVFKPVQTKHTNHTAAIVVQTRIAEAILLRVSGKS